MSRAAPDPVRLHARVDGDSTAPALVLGPSLGTTLRMWDPQVDALAARWRVVRFDTRGHGGSPAPCGAYSLAGLTDDVLRTLDDLGVEEFAYCGLSLGGAIGQQLAADQPDRVRSLVLCCTAARFGSAAAWRDRAARVRAEGTDWLVDSTRERWFTDGFRDRDPGRVEWALAMLRETAAEGYAGCCDALADFDARERLSAIEAPTLVIAGEDDPATPPAVAAELADGIPDATLLVVPQAAHLASLEQPEAVTEAVSTHLERTWR